MKMGLLLILWEMNFILTGQFEIGTDRVKIHYFVGKNSTRMGEKANFSPNSLNFSMSGCSHSLTNGGDDETHQDTFLNLVISRIYE